MTAVERFVEAVEETLPDDARVIKTIGDEVMVVGSDPAALTDWAVGFQALHDRAPAAAHRHPLRRDALPRRRLLRARGQPGRAGGGARGRRRGAGHAPGRRRRRRPPRVRAASARSGSRASPTSTELFLARAARRMRCRRLAVRRRARARRAGLLARRTRPCVVLLSGGRDSTCLLDVARARSPAGGGAPPCTSTTGCAPTADADEAHCARAVRAARRGAGGAAAAPAGRRRQPPGLGARRALRGGARLARGRGATSRPATRPPTRPRPSSTAWPRRPGGARCWAWPPRDGRLVRPLLGVTRERDRRLLPRARPGLARGRDQRRRTPSRATACARARCPRCARSTRRPRRNVLRTAELLREEAAVLDEVVDDVLDGRDEIALDRLRGAAAGAGAAGRAAAGRGRGRRRSCRGAAAPRRGGRSALGDRRRARPRRTAPARAYATAASLRFEPTPAAEHRT